jgi:16S rRNA (uracil1498-N3)-methyltransferase
MRGEAAHHLGRVLRAQPGQVYELSDGETVWLGQIKSAGRDNVEFALVEKVDAYQPATAVTLLLSVVKFDAFEWALEKATELGVSRIVPLAARRSEKGLLAAAPKRSERWAKILLEASQQSRRVRLPELSPTAKPAVAFLQADNTCRVILSERADAQPMRRILGESNTAKVATLAIGPEGGWTDEEIAAARKAGFAEASLGKLILRTETAVIAALASLNYALAQD